MAVRCRSGRRVRISTWWSMGMTGNMVQARYTDPQGNSFSLTLTADSPLVDDEGSANQFVLSTAVAYRF